jgi:hypothetical protein
MPDFPPHEYLDFIEVTTAEDTSTKVPENHEEFSYHASEFLAVLLNMDCHRIPRWMRVHGVNDGSNRWFLVVSCWWVCDIGSEEDDRLVEYLRAYGWNEDRVDAIELNVNLQAKVRKCLR